MNNAANNSGLNLVHTSQNTFPNGSGGEIVKVNTVWNIRGQDEAEGSYTLTAGLEKTAILRELSSGAYSIQHLGANGCWGRLQVLGSTQVKFR